MRVESKRYKEILMRMEQLILIIYILSTPPPPPPTYIYTWWEYLSGLLHLYVIINDTSKKVFKEMNNDEEMHYLKQNWNNS